MLYIDCPTCGKRLAYADAVAGLSGKCSRCARIFRIPAETTDDNPQTASPSRRKLPVKRQPLKFHVCEVFLSQFATPDELKDAGKKIFDFSLDGHLNGVRFDTKGVESLLMGKLPVFISWTAPEIKPIILRVRQDMISEVRLAQLLERIQCEPAFSEIKLNGVTIR